MVPLPPVQRSAKEIIDEAISDNRTSEYLAYCFATVFVLVGVAVIVWSMFTKEPLATLGGSIESVLFWPALNSVRRTRKENIAIRLRRSPFEHGGFFEGRGGHAEGCLPRTSSAIIGVAADRHEALSQKCPS
jgi:hypothetical protein